MAPVFKEATLTRNNDAGEDGTLGTLELDGLTLFTLEEDRNGNQRRVSCIPPGRYRCDRTIYHKHDYETFEVMDVPGRDRILIHPGNTEEDTEGCILVGIAVGNVPVKADEDDPQHRPAVKRGVIRSRAAFEQFMRKEANVTHFWLTIIDPFWKD